MITNEKIDICRRPSPLEGEGGRSSDEGLSEQGCIIAQRFYSKETLSKAQELRQNMTNVENILWYYLRSKQLNGLKFRRQVPIGKYIADFICFQHKLIIELDGGGHADETQILYDQQRDVFLQGAGYRVLRVWNNEIYENIEGVLGVILITCSEDPSPYPLPQGEGNKAEKLSQGEETS